MKKCIFFIVVVFQGCDQSIERNGTSSHSSTSYPYGSSASSSSGGINDNSSSSASSPPFEPNELNGLWLSYDKESCSFQGWYTFSYESQGNFYDIAWCEGDTWDADYFPATVNGVEHDFNTTFSPIGTYERETKRIIDDAKLFIRYDGNLRDNHTRFGFGVIRTTSNNSNIFGGLTIETFCPNYDGETLRLTLHSGYLFGPLTYELGNNSLFAESAIDSSSPVIIEGVEIYTEGVVGCSQGGSYIKCDFNLISSNPNRNLGINIEMEEEFLFAPIEYRDRCLFP